MPSLFTNRLSGSSRAPYESRNFARHVGDSEFSVRENRMVLEKSVPPVQFMNQVHGDSVCVVDQKIDVDPTCDALITKTHGLALAVMSADCIPLLLSSQHVISAVHVGRAGLINQIAIKVIEKMRELGAVSIHAQLGPSICGTCYEVPQNLADEVLNSHPSAFSLTRDATPSLNLPRALIDDLLANGVTYEASTICTLENADYFSYRRHNITGRNAGVIWL